MAMDSVPYSMTLTITIPQIKPTALELISNVDDDCDLVVDNLGIQQIFLRIPNDLAGCGRTRFSITDQQDSEVFLLIQ